MKTPLPRQSDFPHGTEFLVKEFDVPLAKIADGEKVEYFNWYGGTPQKYDPAFLRVDNNWRADSFESWVGLIRESIR
jgi:hypothetical protein